MAIDYQTREWKDDQAGGTPIDAANLNRMEQGIANACAGVDEIKGPGGVSADMIADGSISESKLSEGLRDFVSQKQYIIGGTASISTNSDGVAQIDIVSPNGSKPDAAFTTLCPPIADLAGRIYDVIPFQWTESYLNVRVRNMDTGAWAGSNQNVDISWMCLWNL